MKGVLFDLDGVLYDAGEAVPGAAETVAWVRAQGIPHLFLTNTTSRPRAALVEKLARFGIETDAVHLLTPPAAAAAWLRDRPGPVALFVPAACRGEFAGCALVPDDAETGAAYVVVGDLAERWDFATLNRAFRLLHADPAAQLLALGMTRFWKSPTGIALDVAPFVVALEHASGRQAVVLGKPAPAFFAAAVGKLGLEPAEVLMVGDDVVTDVGGAQAAGLRAALVRTGKFRPSDVEGDVEPDAVFDSVADLPARWASLG